MSPAPTPRLQEKLAAILEITRRMNCERDLDTLLDLVGREAARLLDADRATVFLLDREKMELWCKAPPGSGEVLRFDARKGVAGAATLNSEVTNVSDLNNDRRFNPSVDGQNSLSIRNLLVVPLLNPVGGVTGAIEALNKRGGAFSREDEELLLALAAQAAIAIETVRLIADLRRESRRVSGTSLKAAVGNLERELIAEVLRSTGNNQLKAARLLGISRQGLINKIKRYRIGAIALGSSG